MAEFTNTSRGPRVVSLKPASKDAAPEQVTIYPGQTMEGDLLEPDRAELFGVVPAGQKAKAAPTREEVEEEIRNDPLEQLNRDQALQAGQVFASPDPAEAEAEVEEEEGDGRRSSKRSRK
jgi:hypothetical protein